MILVLMGATLMMWQDRNDRVEISQQNEADLAGLFEKNGELIVNSGLRIKGDLVVEGVVNLGSEVRLKELAGLILKVDSEGKLGGISGTELAGGEIVNNTYNTYYTSGVIDDDLFYVNDDAVPLVGLGTTNPQAKLQINTTNSATVGFAVMAEVGQTADLLDIVQSGGQKVARFDYQGKLLLDNNADHQIEIRPSGNTGYLSSTGGAIFIQNSSNIGTGIGIYSDRGADAEGNMINVKVDNIEYDQAAFYMNYDGTSNAVEIVSNTDDTSSNALSITNYNQLDSALGVIGYETGRGTVKITHRKDGTDTNASGLSIDLQGTGTAAQGIYVDSTVFGGTTGNLLRLRNETLDRFVVDSDGSLSLGRNGTNTNITKYGNTEGDEFYVGTNGAFRVQRSATDSEAFRTQIVGDTQGRWLGTADGKLKFGDGSSSQDVVLQRTGAGLFQLDTDIQVVSQSTNNDVITVTASDGSRLSRLTETSGGAGWFEIDNATGNAVWLFRADGGDSYISGGQFGVGTTAPTAAMDVGGGIMDNIDGTNDLLVAGDLEVDGTIYGNVVGTITDTGYDPGGVLFADNSGVLTQDAANFYWDDSNNRVGIGTSLANALVSINNGAPLNGAENLSTTGSSVTVTTTNNAFANVEPGAMITANGVIRWVKSKTNSNTIVIDTATNWSSGYAFTFSNPILTAESQGDRKFVIRDDGSIFHNVGYGDVFLGNSNRLFTSFYSKDAGDNGYMIGHYVYSASSGNHANGTDIAGYFVGVNAGGSGLYSIGLHGEGSSESSNTTTNAIGLNGAVTLYSSGDITNAIAVNAEGIYDLGSGGYDNAYGIYINDISSGQLSNFQLFSSGTAPSYLAGKLGLGTTNPVYSLDVKASGTGVIARFNSDNNTGCTLADGGTISCSSDIVLKKNIDEIGSSLERVLALSPVEFNWKSQSDGTTKQGGFIAQEVESIFPDLVSIDNEGLKSVSMVGMIPYLTRAVQEQDVKINDQYKMVNEEIHNSEDGEVSAADTVWQDFEALRLKNVELAMSLEELDAKVIALQEFKDKLIKHIGFSENLISFVSEVVFGAKTKFMQSVEFVADATFRGSLRVNADTAGTVNVPPHTAKFRVNFEKEFSQVPIVYLTSENSGGVKYETTEVNTKYFEVMVKPVSEQDIAFKWLALISDDNDLTQLEILESSDTSVTEVEIVDQITRENENEIIEENTLDETDEILNTIEASASGITE